MTTKSSNGSSGRLKYTFCNDGKREYFRHPLIGVHRLRGRPGEPQYHRDYAEKLAELEVARKQPRRLPATVGWLVDEFQKSPEFKKILAERTQQEYAPLLSYVADKIGSFSYRKLKPRHVVKLRNTLSETPRKADHMVSALSAAFTWKIDQHDEDLVNPCRGIKRLHRKADVEGYVPWTEDQIDFFLKKCQTHFVVPVSLGLYTGQRLSDCVPMETNRLTGNTITVVTNKTGEFVEIAVHPKLKKTLKKTTGPTFVVGKRGEPYKDPKSFSKELAKEIRRLGLPRLTFHGLRYAACARLEDIGCTPYEVEDIVGHRTYEMAKAYMSKRRTREKVQRLLTESATPPKNSA